MSIVGGVAFGQNVSALDNVVESVTFHDTPIQDVLRLFAAQNNLNLIIGPDSMSSVSLQLSGVTLRSALDAILRSKGYQYQIYDNILVVTVPDSLERQRGLGLETEIIHLQFADARDVKSVIDTARVLSPWGQLSVYSPLVKTDAGQAERLIRGQAITDQPMSTRSEVLIITDRQSNIRQVKQLIAGIDKEQKQLLIDVHFVETILDEQNQMGVDWSSILQVDASRSAKTSWTLGDVATNSFIQVGSLPQMQFKAVLDVMIKEQRANLLSQPRITTLDNQPASIFVGVTTWIEQRTGNEQTGNTQVTYIERQVPIELVVVPHIIQDKRIQLELRPKVEEITGWQQGSGGVQLPIISTRTSDSRIEVLNGETAIIGGLIKEKTLINEKNIWGLSKIPLLGNLFKHKRTERLRTDLTIFITTHIIESNNSLEKYQETKNHLLDNEIINKKIFDVVDKSESIAVKQVAPQEAEAKEEPQADEIDLFNYFPLANNIKLEYRWKEVSGSSWRSSMKSENFFRGNLIFRETTNNNDITAEAKSSYRWTSMGLENLFRIGNGGDSTAFIPGRNVIPAKMIPNKEYSFEHQFRRFDTSGNETAKGTTVQIHKLLGIGIVTTEAGRFRDCIAVETVWWNKSPVTPKMRKVVWYALGVGPIKIENDIPFEEDNWKGKSSGLLVSK